MTATVFWVGEPKGRASSENNALSAWDDAWLKHYGGVDVPSRRSRRNGWFPRGFRPKENPFYVDLPYDDFVGAGKPRPDRSWVVPWAWRDLRALAAANRRDRPFSLLKNRWVQVRRGRRICYAQWEDAGPYVYDDAAYVFGNGARGPRNRRAQGAGMDVSPAVRDCLGFRGLDNANNKVSWRFVDVRHVPRGPWTRVVTRRQVYWP